MGTIERRVEEARGGDTKVKQEALEALHKAIEADGASISREKASSVADAVQATLLESSSAKAVQSALFCAIAIGRASPMALRSISERITNPCLEKLGDAKHFVRSAAREALLLIASSREGMAHWLLERVESERTLHHKNWRVREETLSLCKDILSTHCLAELPGASASSFLPLCAIALLDDTIASVRMAAMDLLEVLYSMLGQTLRDEVSRANIRSTHMRELQQRFDAADGNDPQSPEHATGSTPADRKQRRRSSAGQSAAGTSASAHDAAAQAPSYEQQLLQRITHVSDEHDASKKLSEIVAQMGSDVEWNKRREAVCRLVELVSAAKSMSSFAQSLRGEAASALYSQLTDRRSAVAKEAAHALSECVKHLGRETEYLLEGLNAIETLAGLAQQTVQVVADAAEATMRTVVIECPSPRLLRQVASACKGHRSAKARLAAVRALGAAVDEWSDADVDGCAEQLRDALTSGASDAGQDTRKAARQAINRLYERRQQLAESIISHLHPQHRRGLAQIGDSASSTSAVSRKSSMPRSASDSGSRRRPSSASSLPAASRSSKGRGDPKVEVVSAPCSHNSTGSKGEDIESDTHETSLAKMSQNDGGRDQTKRRSSNVRGYENDLDGRQQDLSQSASSPDGFASDIITSRNVDEEPQDGNISAAGAGKSIAHDSARSPDEAFEEGRSADEQALRHFIELSRLHGSECSVVSHGTVAWATKTDSIKAAEQVCRQGELELFERLGAEVLCAAADILNETQPHPRTVTAALELCNSAVNACPNTVVQRSNEYLIPALCVKLSDPRDSVKSLASASLQSIAYKSAVASLIPGIVRALDSGRPPRTRAAAMEVAAEQLANVDTLTQSNARSLATKAVESALERQPQMRKAALNLLAKILGLGGHAQAGCLEAIGQLSQQRHDSLTQMLEDYYPGACALLSSVTKDDHHQQPQPKQQSDGQQHSSLQNEYTHSESVFAKQQARKPHVEQQKTQQQPPKSKSTDTMERKIYRAVAQLRRGKSPEEGVRQASAEASRALNQASHSHAREAAARVLGHSAQFVPPEAPIRLARCAALDEQNVAGAAETALLTIVRSHDPLDGVRLLLRVIEDGYEGDGASEGAARYLRHAVKRLVELSPNETVKELQNDGLLSILLQMLKSPSAPVRLGASKTLADLWYHLGDSVTPVLKSSLTPSMLRLVTSFVHSTYPSNAQVNGQQEQQQRQQSPQSAVESMLSDAAVTSKSPNKINQLQQKQLSPTRSYKYNQSSALHSGRL
jgi:CLIP-associating protein 1/2